jgi:acid phosphatase (class A)
MKLLRLGLFGSAVIFVLPGRSQENMMQPGALVVSVLNRFARIDALDMKSIVPPPPAAGSVAAQSELQTLLQIQAWRTDEQVAWARTVARDVVFNCAAIIGSWFTPERLPRTTAFFNLIADDMKALDALAKKPFLRQRPSQVDARIEPCVTTPPSTSYPSGSATQSLVWAELLAEVFPAKREELLNRAERAAWGRVIGGVHYPSDLVAGQMLARAYLAECRKSQVFQEAFAASRAELVAAAKAGE